MANAKQKISLNASRDIPFNKLVLSQSNVRRIKNGQTIDCLAASIARRESARAFSFGSIHQLTRIWIPRT